jgi:hypothetical protein
LLASIPFGGIRVTEVALSFDRSAADIGAIIRE